MRARTFLATDSGWSLASRSRVARKFLHLTLAVSGVICWPILLAAELGVVVVAGGAGVRETGCVGSRGCGMGGRAGATGGGVCGD